MLHTDLNAFATVSSSVDAFVTAMFKRCVPGVFEDWYISSLPYYYLNLTGVGKVRLAPVGISACSIVRTSSGFTGFRMATNAVMGTAKLFNFTAFSYYNNGSLYGKAFAIRLGAFVVAQLADKTTRYYRVEAAALFDKDKARLASLLMNYTAFKILQRREKPDLNVLEESWPYLDQRDVRGSSKITYGYNHLGDHVAMYNYTSPMEIGVARWLL